MLRDDGACGYYRAELPFKSLSRAESAEVVCIEKGDPAPKFAWAIENCEAMLIPRMESEELLSIAKRARAELGIKFVIDWDDDIFNVSPLSSHYVDWGADEATIELGGVTHTWKDGDNIDLASNRKRLDAVRRSLEAADMVTVTTEEIARVYRAYNENVKILPNCVDMNLWRRLPLVRPDPVIRMGWFGGSSHYIDWLQIAGVLPEIMRKHPNLRLVIMGQKFGGTIKGIPAHQLEHHPWVNVHAYPYKAAILDLDFAIIPLADNEFNRCKSPIKWIEMASLGVPAVTSFVKPYSEVMDLVPDNGLFVEANDPKGWTAGISMMVDLAMGRRQMADAAQETVRKHFDISSQLPLWVNAYQEIINGSPVESNN